MPRHEKDSLFHELEQEIGIVEPQAVTDLLATARQQNAQRRRLAFLGLCFVVPIALIAAFPGSPVSILSYLFTLFLVAFIGARFIHRYRKTTLALAKVDDVRMVGPLIERLPHGRKGRRTRRAVRQALMRLLPRLKVSDAGLLTPDQKGRLAHYLGHLAMFQRDKELQVVILRALEQVGDAQALPVVERIAERQPHWPAQEQVHTAAECLPFLRQRAEEETSRRTLLRAAGQGTEGGGQLLRAAEGVTEGTRANSCGPSRPQGKPPIIQEEGP